MSDMVIKLTLDASGLKVNLEQVTNALREITGKPVTIETSAAESGIRRLRDEVAMWGLALRGAVDSFRMIGQALNVVLEPALEAEQGLNRVKAVVESTGQAAGFAAEEIARQAADIQEAFAFDDDMIMNDLMTPLLTFTNVTGEAFQQAQVAIMDMNRALGEDGGGLKAVAQQVGKALQDPITGLTALRRSGVSFSDEQQKVIKSLVDAGDAAGAQKIILAELNKEFGGQAAAYADSYAGRLAKLKLAMGDLAQSVGELLLPILTALAEIVKPLIEWFTGLDGVLKVLIVTLPLLTAGWYKLIAAKVTAAAVTGTLTGAIVAASAAVKGFLVSIGPVGWALLAVTAGVTAFSLVAKSAKKEVQELGEGTEDFEKALSQVKTEALGSLNRFESLVKVYEDLRDNQRRTSEQTMLYRNTIATLKREYPSYFSNLDMEKGKYDQIKSAISATRRELDQLARKRIQDAIVSQYSSQIAKAQMELDRLQDVYTGLWEKQKAMSTRNNIMNSLSSELLTKSMNRTQEDIRVQIDLIDAYNARMQAALEKGLTLPDVTGGAGGGGGGAAGGAVGNVDEAISDWERLEQRLSDYFTDEGLRLFRQYNQDKKTIDEEFNANSSKQTKEQYKQHYEAMGKLDDWYTEELRKLNERLAAKRLEDEEKYYEKMKGQDDKYWEWRKLKIEAEVRKLDLNEQQREALKKAYLADLEKERAGGNTASVAQLDAYYEEVKFKDQGYYDWKRAKIAEEVALMGLSAEQAKVMADERLKALDEERAAYERLPVEEVLQEYREFKSEMSDTKEMGVAGWKVILNGLQAIKDKLLEFKDVPGVGKIIAGITEEIQVAQMNAGKENKGSWFWNSVLGYDPDSAADKEKVASVQAKIGEIKGFFEGLNSAVSGVINQMMQRNEDRKARELARIDEVAEREKWSDAEILRVKTNINKKYEAEEKKLKRIQQVISISQATINTAEGVTKAFTMGPILGPIFAAIIAATGAAQIALISQQKFASGGLFRGIGGPRDDKNLVWLSNGEYVVNAASTRRFLPLLEAVNKSNASSDTDGGGSYSFAAGGMVEGGGMLAYLGAKLDVVARKLDAVNMNIGNLDLGVTLINHAPDVNTTVEKQERHKARKQAMGKVYQYGV
jgi:hypothetical protein